MQKPRSSNLQPCLTWTGAPVNIWIWCFWKVNHCQRLVTCCQLSSASCLSTGCTFQFRPSITATGNVSISQCELFRYRWIWWRRFQLCVSQCMSRHWHFWFRCLFIAFCALQRCFVFNGITCLCREMDLQSMWCCPSVKPQRITRRCCGWRIALSGGYWRLSVLLANLKRCFGPTLCKLFTGCGSACSLALALKPVTTLLMGCGVEEQPIISWPWVRWMSRWPEAAGRMPKQQRFI